MTRYDRPGWWFAATLWVVFTVVGWATPLVPIMMFTFITAVVHGTSDTLEIGYLAMIGAMFGAGGGVIIGGGQSALLGRLVGGQSDNRARWDWSTVVGMTLGGTVCGTILVPIAVVFGLPNLSIASWAMAGCILGGLLGLGLGVCQSWCLRRLLSSWPWWILVCALTWAAGCAIFWVIYRSLGGPLGSPDPVDRLEPWPSNEVALGALIGGWLLGGIVVGLVTQFALKFLITHPEERY
jgi:hypothetical protein